jgi:hypothetical protein
MYQEPEYLAGMTSRQTGVALCIAAALLIVLGFGLAFTFYGVVALVLGLVAVAGGTFLLSRPQRA